MIMLWECLSDGHDERGIFKSNTNKVIELTCFQYNPIMFTTLIAEINLETSQHILV